MESKVEIWKREQEDDHRGSEGSREIIEVVIVIIIIIIIISESVPDLKDMHFYM